MGEGLSVHYCIKITTGEKVNCLDGWNVPQSNAISRVLGVHFYEKEKENIEFLKPDFV